MKPFESTYDDIARTATLTSGQVIRGFHKSAQCNGEHCPVHNPSDHPYRDLTLRFNYDVFIFEREGQNDAHDSTVWFPDPDDYTMARNDGVITYRNSIRCNKCNDDIVSIHRHHFVECSCKAVFVDGGSAYRRIGGSKEDWTDTSIVYNNGTWEGKEEELKAFFTFIQHNVL